MKKVEEESAKVSLRWEDALCRSKCIAGIAAAGVVAAGLR